MHAWSAACHLTGHLKEIVIPASFQAVRPLCALVLSERAGAERATLRFQILIFELFTLVNSGSSSMFLRFLAALG